MRKKRGRPKKIDTADIEEEEEIPEKNIVGISDLPGIGPVTAKKLEMAGVSGIADLIVRGPVEINQITGVDYAKCIIMITEARKIMKDRGLLEKDLMNGADMLKVRQSIGHISTGVLDLDELLKGGIETRAITELYGEFGCGKTQFCHTLCVMVQRSEKEGGLGGNVLYIDTEGTFRPERILEIADHRAMDGQKALENIITYRAHDSAQQMLILEEAGSLIKKHNIRLIVSDSLTGLFRAEYLGRGTLADRQQRLGRYMRTLIRTAETYNCAVLATNQITVSPDITYVGDGVNPVGGNIVGHTSTYRIYLRKLNKEKRSARIVDSPHHPLSEEIFNLGAGGLKAAEKK